MYFLVEYDRFLQKVNTLRQFDAADRLDAEKARLELEIALGRASIEREVVLLEADSIEALHVTHRRYFESFKTLAQAISQSEQLTGSTAS